MESRERAAVASHIETSFYQQLKNSARSLSPRSSSLSNDWSQQFLLKISNNEKLRVQFLRLIDVLPVLHDDADLVEHFKEYVSLDELPLSAVAKWGLDHSGGLGVRVLAKIIRKMTKIISRQYLVEDSDEKVLQAIQNHRSSGRNISVDLLGELTLTDEETADYCAAYLRLIANLSAPVNQLPDDETLDVISGRKVPKFNVSLKLSAFYAGIKICALENSAEIIYQKLKPVLSAAKIAGVSVTIDMEHYDYQKIILSVFSKIIFDDEFRDWPFIGIAVQAYLRDALQTVDTLIALAEQRQIPFLIRLVRGAYWDQEVIIAKQQAWPVPVWETKAETDACFEQCLKRLIQAMPVLDVAIATHNSDSIVQAMTLLDELGLEKNSIEFQMLYGMADKHHDAIVAMGYPLRVYLPCGDPIPGMAYLVRRLLENSYSQSFENMSGAKKNLVDRPVEKIEAKSKILTHNKTHHHIITAQQAVHRFNTLEQQELFAETLQTVAAKLGRSYPLKINGQEITAEKTMRSFNPAKPDQLVGEVAVADTDQCDAAIAAAQLAVEEWQAMPIKNRAELCRQVAKKLIEKRDEFSAWQIFEAGKTWTEADADVCEAIDFIHYYAEQAERLFVATQTDVPGEFNQTHYQAKGIGVVIPPWNFPLAILTGMLSAAIVSGNCVLLKPSSQTAVIATLFVDLLHDAGIPPAVVQCLPGAGNEVGEYLVQHADISFIAFTGSLKVGNRISHLATKIQKNQKKIKRVITEMGGKNTIIVDADADPDEAINGIVKSAFGFQGQKCSACSRVIVVGDQHDGFIDRLVKATKRLRMGLPEKPDTDIGPVISAGSQQRIARIIAVAEISATKILSVEVSAALKGYYVGASIFTHVDPQSDLAQEEVFGPVLAVISANSFAAAIDIANNTRYALTGGVYSRSPTHIKMAKEKFNVGNLYINRSITGALVGRQPFGGFNMSGSGFKAGGPDYLLQFVDAKTVTENTLRRGFAPPDSG